MARHLSLALLLILATALTAGAQSQPSGSEIRTAIGQLGAFDYAVRIGAARQIRRVAAPDAVPALIEAARNHTDQFVRYRALVLLTAFNDRGTPDLMRSLLRDRNDRVREVAYRWFAQRPEPAMAPTLLELLQTEQAEFVRPALVSALAALGSEPAVQRALISEAGRGLDFFRISVIEALGERRAVYAADVIAAVTKIEGPLQDDAVLALARIGDTRATDVVVPPGNVGAEVTAALHASRCLLGEDCAAATTALMGIASNVRATPQAVRAAVTGLGVIAAKPDGPATSQLFTLARTGPAAARDQAGVEFSIVAVRVPAHLLAWFDTADDAERYAAVELLRSGFERLEEDFAEEQFFAAARAGYWAAADGSAARTRIATLIDKLAF